MVISSTCGTSPCTSLCGGGDWAAAARTLTVVTTGTTQPARISARRVKSCRLRARSRSSSSPFDVSSRRASSLMRSSRRDRSVRRSSRDSRQCRCSAVADRLDRQSGALGQARKSVVTREPLAVCVHEEGLEMAAQPLAQSLGRGLIDLQQPARHQNDEAVHRVGVERDAARTCFRRENSWRISAEGGARVRACCRPRPRRRE